MSDKILTIYDIPNDNTPKDLTDAKTLMNIEKVKLWNEKLKGDFEDIIRRTDIDSLKEHYIESNGEVTLLDFLNSVQMHDTIYGIGKDINKDDMQIETEIER